LVPRGLKADYLAAVVDGGALPPNFHTYLESALSAGGPWESNETTKVRLKIARQQMLGEIIRHMDWVEDAVVLYDEQQSRGLRQTNLVTASVNVKPVLGESVDPRRATILQKLVAHSVVGMHTEDVIVTSLGADNGIGSDGNVYPDAFQNEYYKTRVAYEQYKKQSILNALRDIPGVRVEVNAELDNTIQETIQNLKPDKQGTALSAVTVEEETSQGTVDGGGQPGTTAQGPNRQGTLPQLQAQTQSKTSKSTEETNNLVGQEQTVRQTTGFTPKEDWATVTIPHSYVATIWKQRNPEATAPPKEEDLRLVQENLITKVENIVVPLLTRQNKGEDQYKQVRVEIVDSIPLPEIVPPSFASNATNWAGHYWSTLAMIGVAMFSLLVLRSVVKGGPAGSGSPLAGAAPTLTVHADADGGEGDSDAPQRSRLRIKKGVSLKDDLAEMVREDPHAAAAILKSWIGKAG
jgi:flagellar M-ring protein FliF